jgi:hypothetical protein
MKSAARLEVVKPEDLEERFEGVARGSIIR